ncbi:enoyl-CoA hydratase [Gordonia sp. VNK21]|uniref:enoyl-CoA hydratase n=1 Tax=Gordonia sp. VNK21 TaxID=3382483 RepID=UPI0038D4BB54
MSDYSHIRYETFYDGTVARILLDRPTTRNAQHRGLLVELDDAFERAERDDQVKVVILGGTGPLFSSGHDLGSAEAMAEMSGPDRHPSFTVNGGTRKGIENRMLQEWHYYFENTKRWRNLRKITIAQVQGTTYSAGLMLMWACDLIVGADDASFADVVGTRLGMNAVEYFAHPWELGPRRAKELLLTGDAIDVEEAHRIGMVSKIFPRAELEEKTLQFAARIAKVPTVAALLIKDSVNHSLDNMGFVNSLNAVFTMHQLNHAHWSYLNGDASWPIAKPEHGVPAWNHAPPVVIADRYVADPHVSEYADRTDPAGENR